MTYLRNGLAATLRFVDAQRLFGVAALAALIALRIWDPLPVEVLRLKTLDFYQVLKPRDNPARPVVIIDIDDASLQEIGQWPWPRSQFAEMLETAISMGAVTIGLDILFAEPDRTSPDLMADRIPGLSENAREEMRNARSNDSIFADTLQKARIVLGVSAYNPRPGEALREQFHKPPSVATLGGDPKPFLVNFPNPLDNIAPLEAAANGRGMLTIRPDPDGIVRRVPLAMLAGGEIAPSLTTEMLRLATGQNAFMVRRNEAGVKDVVVARTAVATDQNAQFWVYLSPHDPNRFVSARDVVMKRVAPEAFRGKLVLVGSSASGLLDIKSTAIDPAMPGVEVHAQVLENILTGSTLSRPAYLLGAELLGLSAIGLSLIVFLPIIGAVWALAGGLIISAAAAGISWWAFDTRGLLTDLLYPLLGAAIVFWLLVFWNYYREERQKAQIRSAFGQYISPDLVEELAKDPSRLTLGGQRLEMTVLFSDVQGFTAISELYKDNPTGLTALMNRFLTPLSKAIIDRRGTIDKYMGDAIMAFWNAPLADELHAVHACSAALAMYSEVEALNEIRSKEAEDSGIDFLPLDVGIGINTGACMVGNMGSDMRFDYTVLGDTVNVASRLEGQSRSYDTHIILGDKTAAFTRNEFAVMELDLIRVKGKSEPERVFALLGDGDTRSSAEFQKLEEKNTEMLVAYRAADWAVAESTANEARALGEGFALGSLYDMHLARIAAFRDAPPPAGWDGVFTATSK